MRRSRLLVAMLLMVPGVVLLGFNFVGHLGIFWIALALVFLGAGAFIFRAEKKRL
jgi:dipeptide/tripeptide permease